MFQQHIILSVIIISVFPFLLYWMSMIYSFFFSRTGKNLLSRDFYECGFKTVNDNFSILDIQFSTLGLIFLIYEMEIVFFVPIMINIFSISYCVMFYIVFILFVIFFSYVYEWEKQSLTFSL